ncbi:stage II sporulation protein M [Ectobacillus panaciterrae]|uniref:stage II sporulation protein M n=1 Tax=Ectobacillus panaciterrae TaxID=363872 RepID=UPI000416B650|nr:stage II sporulation protein M [Ectobacillus panaciterrae]
MNKVNSLLEKEVHLLRNTWQHSKKTFWRYWLATLIIIIITYLIASLLHLDAKKFVQGLDKFSSDTTSNKESYWQGTILLFKNNWTVCFQILILSLVPVPFLYTLSLTLTSAITGVVIYLSQKVGMSLFSTIVLGLLPHSILELSVFIITSCYGGKINQIIRGKIMNTFRHDKKNVLSLWEHLKKTCIVFMFVITPFIFIAAFIEGYITRFLLN